MPTETLRIACVDGVELSANIFSPDAGSSRDVLPVLLSPATAVKQSFYFSFCRWLSERGFTVMTFDYRGIGDSLMGEVRHSTARLQDWGQLDQAAAISALLDKTGNDRAILLGHSAGGQLVGINSRYKQIEKVVAVSSSSGYFGGMPLKMKTLAWFLLRLYVPVSNQLFGCGKINVIGWGEDLPKAVGQQWGDWCKRPGYVENALGNSIFDDFHDDLLMPITVLRASDDSLATRENVEDLLRLFPSAKTSIVDLIPEQFGYASIGHMDMFRRSRQDLWPVIESHLLA